MASSSRPRPRRYSRAERLRDGEAAPETTGRRPREDRAVGRGSGPRALPAAELNSALGSGDAELLGDGADGFGKGDVLDLLDKAEDVAGDSAAEAVEELARGVDGERRRLFAVEGAQAGVVLRAGFAQLDVVADDADDIGLLLDGVGEISGVSHTPSLPHCAGRDEKIAGPLCGKGVGKGAIALQVVQG